MFNENSRYADAGSYLVTLPDGTPVNVTRIPLPQPRAVIGWHRRADDERLDHVAFRRLGDATAAWQLGWTNDAMVLDALARHELIAIPRPE
jgi:hypothetical protein